MRNIPTALLYRTLLFWVGLPIVLASNPSGDVSAVMAAERPNVLVIQTDDQGWGDVSLHGNQNLSTPHLDSLARRGARFDRFYVCPVCAPTRAELLTGRYHLRGGVTGVSRGDERLNLDERTIAQAFKASGYATAAFGKWHNGTQYPYHPNARGFDEFYGFCSGHWGDYFSPPLERNGQIVQGTGYLVDDFTDRAMRFIERNAEQNFFVYLPLPTPHSPMQVPDKYWDRMKSRELKLRANEGDREDEAFTRAALAMVECIDDNVGKLIDKLNELKLADNTIVVFLSDNGPNSYRWNGGMKGKKGSTDEGGVRSPLYIAWPGHIPANKLVTQISGVIDLFPTLAALADVPLIDTKPLDGISLVPLLTGEVGAIPNRMIFSHWNRQVSVRTQHYRLDHQGQLFDMVIDPGQQKSITEQRPEIAQELRSFVERWKKEMFSGSKLERPFTVGHAEFPSTLLPARDGDPHGAIQRSAAAPNCSYFSNWKDSEDKVTWPVEILTAGNFEVEVFYACPEESVGSEIELAFGDTKIRRAISAANDPPASGAEHDRVPRQSESLVKDFKPLKLGQITLPADNGVLTLRAPQLVGSEGIEIQQLLLKRVR